MRNHEDRTYAYRLDAEEDERIYVKARELLDNTTPSPWEIHPDHGTVEPDVIGGEGCRFEASDTDLDLIAAAPDLAQTVIDQAKKISELELSWDYQRLVLDAAKDEIAALTELLNNSDIYPTAKETP